MVEKYYHWHKVMKERTVYTYYDPVTETEQLAKPGPWVLFDVDSAPVVRPSDVDHGPVISLFLRETSKFVASRKSVYHTAVLRGVKYPSGEVERALDHLVEHGYLTRRHAVNMAGYNTRRYASLKPFE